MRHGKGTKLLSPEHLCGLAESHGRCVAGKTAVRGRNVGERAEKILDLLGFRRDPGKEKVDVTLFAQLMFVNILEPDRDFRTENNAEVSVSARAFENQTNGFRTAFHPIMVHDADRKWSKWSWRVLLKHFCRTVCIKGGLPQKLRN